MPLPGNLMTTAMAVMPHTDADQAIKAVLTLDIPFWPQLPHLSYYEDMYVQAAEHFPGIVLDMGKKDPASFRVMTMNLRFGLARDDENRWERRKAVVGWFEKQGRSVLAANTHFDFTPAVQARSADLVMTFIKRFPPGLSVIITGDFNAGHDSSAFQVFQAHGFREVFESNPPGTFHNFTGKTDGRHIDWILYRGNIRPGSPRVMTFHKGAQYPSDHFPVTADFTWGQDMLSKSELPKSFSGSYSIISNNTHALAGTTKYESCYSLAFS